MLGLHVWTQPVRDECMPAPDVLEFEEPLTVFREEIEALSMLPHTEERVRSIAQLRERMDATLLDGALKNALDEVYLLNERLEARYRKRRSMGRVGIVE